MVRLFGGPLRYCPPTWEPVDPYYDRPNHKPQRYYTRIHGWYVTAKVDV